MGEKSIQQGKNGLKTQVDPPFPKSLQKEWLGLKWGMVILPFNPILSLPGLLFALFVTWKKEYKRLFNSLLGIGFGILSLWLIVTTVLADNRGEAALGLANFLPYFGVLLAFHLLVPSTVSPFSFFF